MKNWLLSALAIGLLFGHVEAQTAPTITFTAQTTTGAGVVKPVLTWATTPAANSCTAGGSWSGTKAASGTETLADITKSATYDITCTWNASSSIRVRWTLPTTNTDGSALTNLAGTRVVYGTSPTALNTVVNLGSPTATTTLIDNLAPGTYYFQAKAYNTAGTESDLAPVPPLSKVLAAASDTRSVSITVNAKPSPITALSLE